MDTCVVMGRALGSNAVDVVIANRLVRLCCPGCVSQLKADPSGYFAKIDEASKE